MAERLADIVAKITNVRQLEAVVTAMRGIAASHAQQARSLLAGIEAYSDVVARAMGEALALLPTWEPVQPPAGRQGHGLICLCRARLRWRLQRSHPGCGAAGPQENRCLYSWHKRRRDRWRAGTSLCLVGADGDAGRRRDHRRQSYRRCPLCRGRRRPDDPCGHSVPALCASERYADRQAIAPGLILPASGSRSPICRL